MPALRINALSVPIDSSGWRGIERFARDPGLVKTTWLPTCPTLVQPACPNALTACFPEMFARRAIGYTATRTASLRAFGGALARAF